jgi:hypothetical protein
LKPIALSALKVSIPFRSDRRPTRAAGNTTGIASPVREYGEMTSQLSLKLASVCSINPVGIGV